MVIKQEIFWKMSETTKKDSSEVVGSILKMLLLSNSKTIPSYSNSYGLSATLGIRPQPIYLFLIMSVNVHMCMCRLRIHTLF